MENKKRIQYAWCMYDWANSVFPLTITSAIFPIYWDNQFVNGLNLLGIDFSSSILYSFCISIAFLIIALINPLLGGIADTAGNKKTFMSFFVVIGSISCMSMYFFTKENYWVGILTLIVGTIGYAGSIVFYNSYLPEIAEPKEMDKLSAKGFSFGYFGAVLLLIVNLFIIMNPQSIYNFEAKLSEFKNTLPSLSNEELVAKTKSYFSGVSSRNAFFSVGVWWLLFYLIPFYYLPVNKSKKTSISFKKGYEETRKVFAKIKGNENISRFLLAIFFSSMGVQTIMYVAGLFGKHELGLETKVLITTILIIQLIAIVGAFITSFMSKKFGNVKTLIIMGIIWMGICIFALFVYRAQEFYILAAIVGLVMGGIQSLSRSTYSKLIPVEENESTSYFSFYELTEKVAIVLGTFVFGLIEFLIHLIYKESSMRHSILALFVFFLISVILLIRAKNIKLRE